ncbi:MAG: glycosyl hydrolase [Solirubrobacterales bacterium]
MTTSPRRALALTALVVALAACVSVSPTTASSGQPPQPLYWGAVIGTQLTGEAAPWDIRAVYKFEQAAHKGISLLSFSSPFADCSSSPCSYFPFPTAEMEVLRQQGIIPFLSWAAQSVPSSVNEPRFRLASVIRGEYDSYIRRFAEAAREWGHPFFLRFDPEMNGFWFPWSEGVNRNRPGQFVAAWRHVHDIFTSVGATNATWVWCPNVDFAGKLTPLSRLYPGNEYVDWTCLDGFNWGKTANSSGWMSFNRIFRSTYNQVLRLAPSKPMVIGETASEERGGSKRAWIRDALGAIPSTYPAIRGFIYYDEKNQQMNWPIGSSRSATRAFARGIQRTAYQPNLYSELSTSPIGPPTWP